MSSRRGLRRHRHPSKLEAWGHFWVRIGLPMQTHPSEQNRRRWPWVAELFPRRGLPDVYERFGCWARVAILWSLVPPYARERARLAEAGAGLRIVRREQLFMGRGSLILRG